MDITVVAIVVSSIVGLLAGEIIEDVDIIAIIMDAEEE